MTMTTQPVADLSPADIDAMSYTQIIALLRETNRCPGGKRSVLRIARLAGLHAESRVLEVGCNSGFTSVELAACSRAQITGVDVSGELLAEAERRRTQLPTEMADRITFSWGDAHHLPFPDDTFDLVVVGGATSFMDDKEGAVSEYTRVVKPYGLVSVTTLYYRLQPPDDVVRDVGAVIGVPIEGRRRDEWLELFLSTGLELYHYEENELASRSDEALHQYVGWMVNQEHLVQLGEDARAALTRRWTEIMMIFNRNHAYLGYMLTLLRRLPFTEQPEFFVPPHLRFQ